LVEVSKTAVQTQLPFFSDRRLVLFLAATFLMLSPAHTNAAQQSEGSSKKDVAEKVEGPGRVRLVTSLKGADALKFQLGERLQTKIPGRNKDSVGAVLLKREDSLSDQPATVEAKTLFQQGKLYLEFEARMIERLLYQPLEIKIDQKGLNRIVYIPVANSKTNSKTKDSTTDSFSPNWYVRLDSATPLAALVGEDAKLKIESEIGTVDVTLDTVAAIRFSKDANVPSTFVFKNGDKITGAGRLDKQIKIQCQWGAAQLDTARIQSMTRDEKATFIQGIGSNAKQFFLTKPKPSPAGQAR